MDPNLTLVLQGLVLAGMMIGLLGLVVPIFPGLVVIWLSALVYAITAGFGGWVGVVAFIFISLLMIAGSLVDNLFMGAKTLQGGGNWWTLGIGTVAGVAGSIFFPPLGGIIAALLAVFAFELIRHKDWKKALELTKGMALGCGWAFVARFGIGIVMIGLWLLWVYVKL
ncbi:MAG TPA: DUF456 domain-containing protein [Anaerolineaceae bacterium]|nr:DUF456 domain-containing protein [Anaerolineaceae bacterium]